MKRKTLFIVTVAFVLTEALLGDLPMTIHNRTVRLLEPWEWNIGPEYIDYATVNGMKGYEDDEDYGIIAIGKTGWNREVN